MDRLALLKKLSFGSQIAEQEADQLQSYFVQTEQWERIFTGEVDIIRGEKGAGKSAIYLLLRKNSEKLFDAGTLTVSAENPRGNTVFRDLISDPPASEREFVILWKIYLLVLICFELRSLGVDGKGVSDVYYALEDAKLLERDINLASLLRSAQAFARRLLSVARLEAGIELDQTTMMPSGIIGRISLYEPTADLREKGINSLDGMYFKVNRELDRHGYNIWVLLDRLDVAFSDSHQLEANALRALFKVYSDFGGLDRISLKIFLREDIWKRITEGGFREASHLVRFEIMKWTHPMLLNLMMKRILNNSALVDAFHVDGEEILKDFKKQEEFFDRIFPPQVDQGARKVSTFDWMMTRCADGTRQTAPRELIHLLNCVKDEEIRRLERGGTPPQHDNLFDRSVFKAALPTVSKTRLETYIYAEYPAEKVYIEDLTEQKAEQTAESLSKIWDITKEEASRKASELVEIGFFEQRGERSSPTFWVPFLYRDALKLVQGRADTE